MFRANLTDDFLLGKTLLIKKPYGWTSFDVVKKIRGFIQKKMNVKKIKVGHAGTLDPLATGLLIVCIGKHTKRISNIQNQDKVYTGDILFGSTTPSYDLETEANAFYKTSHITKKMVEEAITRFIGKVMQKPPLFSALKKDGERLYKKARRGERISVDSREITIYRFDITNFNMPKISFSIKCGKGTYIRSIAHDLGVAVNSGAHLTKLCRTAIGEHHLSDALDIVSFEKKFKI